MSDPAQVFRPPNTLRSKVGGGFGINADAIAKAWNGRAPGKGARRDQPCSTPGPDTGSGWRISSASRFRRW